MRFVKTLGTLVQGMRVQSSGVQMAGRKTALGKMRAVLMAGRVVCGRSPPFADDFCL